MRLQDPSWDGPGYHAPAAIEMLSGWNPNRTGTGLVFLDSYPHGAWAARAVLAGAFGGNLGAGRLLGVLSNLAIFAIAIDFFTRWLPALSKPKAAAVAALLWVSPLAVGQASTDLVDGLLGAYAMGFLLSLFKIDQGATRLNYVTAISFGTCLWPQRHQASTTRS